ncbi:HAMP domain-containing protein [Photobacterium sp. SDRW27]|uniref:HAMP domain-containing protein n=1 Tax=Photobacterium obscurum TaxID=2829490 RepID=UPI002244667E|nr:HAMP domain-containing protein [Photobacterium obscurum]MCW8329096.1 HAMP domain-containing protein [Photobacterium obscurum]
MLTFFSWLGSVIITESTDGDAAAINIAGSLRMQAYRIATVVAQPDTDILQLKAETEAFQARLNDPILSQYVRFSGEQHPLNTSYHDISFFWANELKPQLESSFTISPESKRQYLMRVDDFVNDIDHMVLLIQQKAEAKVTLLRVVSGISMFLVVLVMVLAIYGLRLTVVSPLNDLVLAANKIRQGDLSARVTYNGDDELGLLGDSFNQMAEELSALYVNLEQRVTEKTQKLLQANNSLALVYDISQRLNYEQYPEKQFTDILERLESATSLTNFRLCLNQPNIKKSLLVTNTEQIHIKNDDKPQDNCKTCGIKSCSKSAKSALNFPIRDNETLYGTLYACTQSPIETWEQQLLETVAESISTRLRLSQFEREQRRVALMEERALIARELHDSLAQALSYQKFQVAIFEELWRNNDSPEHIEAVIEDLKNGLNSAYRQLRELLTTFRLTIDGAGLESALKNTVEEFNNKAQFVINLDYSLSNWRLSPNEEVSIIQIVREALSNAMHHSEAKQVCISIFDKRHNSIVVQVRDDGIGIDDLTHKSGHYGLSIMKERAVSIHGDITISRVSPSGTCVELIFIPASSQEFPNAS